MKQLGLTGLTVNAARFVTEPTTSLARKRHVKYVQNIVSARYVPYPFLLVRKKHKSIDLTSFQMVDH
jgi:hypothetical protein